MQAVQSTGLGFAVIMGDRSVCVRAVGEAACVPRHPVRNVLAIAATCESFVAILGDGHVVTWDLGFGDLGFWFSGYVTRRQRY